MKDPFVQQSCDDKLKVSPRKLKYSKHLNRSSNIIKHWMKRYGDDDDDDVEHREILSFRQGARTVESGDRKEHAIER